MKKIPVLVLSLLTLPAHAQSMLRILNQHQGTLQAPSSQTSTGTTSSTTSRSVPEVKPSTEQTSSSSVRCESPDQTSMPLAYVTSLIQAENGQLEITHDQRSGKLAISSPDMIGNCSSMLEWTLKRPEIQGKKAYALEVKFKQGDECTESGCTYKIAKVEKGEFQKFETMTLRPTLKGFEECLQKSGVIKDGKVDAGAIYNHPVSEKFDGIKDSGKFYFLSNGPDSKQIKPRYGKFEYINGCDHYESAHPSINSLLSYEDAEKERLDAEAAKLKDCKVEEYGKLAEFIEKYEGYQSELGQVRDRLILEAAKKSAAAIDSGKYTEEDLKVIEDFDRYVVQPKVELARALYEEMLDLEGDAKKAVHDQLVKVLAEISALGKKPYFLSAHTIKLLNAGRFDEAEKLNNLKLTIEHHQRLGAKQDNVVITPGVAAQRINLAKASFAETLKTEKEKYEYKTGQVSGNAGRYRNLAQAHRNNIEVRTRNFTSEIQFEYERMQYGGYCYKYYRNTQKCLQDSMERIQELQMAMTNSNEYDKKKAEEFDQLANEWGQLEAQGRRYVAAQNGEAVEEEPVKENSAPQDTLNPTPRREEQAQAAQPSPYTFQWNGGQQMPQQQAISPYQNNNMFMQQQNPYAYQQQSYMGQQMYQQNPYMNIGMQGGGTTFNWTGGGYPQQGYQQPYQQPQQYGYYPQQQMPYYNQPYQAYGNYNLYGGIRW
jgi:hypothetical protein